MKKTIEVNVCDKCNVRLFTFDSYPCSFCKKVYCEDCIDDNDVNMQFYCGELGSDDVVRACKSCQKHHKKKILIITKLFESGENEYKIIKGRQDNEIKEYRNNFTLKIKNVIGNT